MSFRFAGQDFFDFGGQGYAELSESTPYAGAFRSPPFRNAFLNSFYASRRAAHLNPLRTPGRAFLCKLRREFLRPGIPPTPVVAVGSIDHFVPQVKGECGCRLRRR